MGSIFFLAAGADAKILSQSEDGVIVYRAHVNLEEENERC
jgi:hypothetical protein